MSHGFNRHCMSYDCTARFEFCRNSDHFYVFCPCKQPTVDNSLIVVQRTKYWCDECSVISRLNYDGTRQQIYLFEHCIQNVSKHYSTSRVHQVSTVASISQVCELESSEQAWRSSQKQVSIALPDKKILLSNFVIIKNKTKSHHTNTCGIYYIIR